MSRGKAESRFDHISGPVWLDGRLVPPSQATVAVTDPAVQFGLGIFETIAVREGCPLERAAHLERLTACAERLGVPLPERAGLDAAVVQAAAGVEGGCGWLRVIASRSGRCAVFAGPMAASEDGTSVRAVLLRWRRCPADVLAGLKSLNYAANILGLEEAERRGADEGLWLNTRGHLAEGCSSNLFVVRGRAVFTPAARDGILPGIVRGLAIEAARGLGFLIHEGKVRLPRLLRADEAFLTSSTRGVRPLVEFEGKPVGRGRPGPVTVTIAAEVRRLRGIGGAEAGPSGT
jgi:branched-subunit amino acid aminotransferase/4-amino-4-deoxychorismate lyase